LRVPQKTWKASAPSRRARSPSTTAEWSSTSAPLRAPRSAAARLRARQALTSSRSVRRTRSSRTSRRRGFACISHVV
jgi:hypothetical protein